MDDRRFDELTRQLGRVMNRRRLIGAILGLGGTATLAGAADRNTEARTIGTRPSIPTPPPYTPPTTSTPSPTTTTADPCSSYRCGHECCANELECCDGECCPVDAVCLSRVFGEGPFIKEETCCLTVRTCDDRCCDGVCFTPAGSTATGFGRTCCPSAATHCAGTGDFSSVALCCSDQTPDCCTNPDGSPVCLTTQQCCTSIECANLTDPSRCREGVCTGFTCAADSLCGAGTHCCVGGDNRCCPDAQECCGATCCEAGLACCETTVNGVLLQTCIDPLTQCCTQDHCRDRFGFDPDCVECSAETHICVARNEGDVCSGSECAICQNRHCTDTDSRCTPPDACTPADCSGGVCGQLSVCPETAPSCCGTNAQGCVDLRSDDANCGSCGNQCAAGLVCVSGECICQSDDDCPAIDACTPGQCVDRACVPGPVINCDDGNVCTDDSCDPVDGCRNTARANGPVEGGVCCGGRFFPEGTECCSVLTDCVGRPCHSRTCLGGICNYSNLCFPFNDCQTAACNSQGVCDRTTFCGDYPPSGTNQLCDYGCQCPSSTVCSKDALTDPYVCRGGGGGRINAPFCPPR